MRTPTYILWDRNCTIKDFMTLDDIEQLLIFNHSKLIVDNHQDAGWQYESRQINDFFITYRSNGKDYEMQTTPLKEVFA